MEAIKRFSRLGTIIWISGVLLIVVTSAGVVAKSTLTYWYYGTPGDIEVMEKIVEDFEKENPDIEVKFVNVVPGLPNMEKWLVAVAAGVPPDVSLANWGIFTALSDALQPLDELIRDSKVLKPENFWPGHWYSQIYQGKMLGLPFRANSQVILYNVDMFEEAGIAGLPKTWAEFANLAARLTKRTGDQITRWGYSFRNMPLNRTVNHWAQRNGWIAFNEDYTKVYYTDKKLVDTLTFLNNMVVQKVAAIPGDPGVGQLGQGKAAMLTEGPWTLPAVRAADPDINVAAFVPPAGPSGERPYANLGGENLVMFRAAKDKNAALRFMEYLVYTRNSDYNRATGAFLPVVSNALRDPYWAKSPIWRAVMENYHQALMWPVFTPGGVKLASSDAFDKALDSIFRQKSDIYPALVGVQKIAEDVDIKNPDLRKAIGKH